MRKIMLSLVPVLIGMSGSAMAAVPDWKISEVSGDVRINQNGHSRAAVRGALLSSGAAIVTGDHARAVIVRGEEFVVVSPHSQLRVPTEKAETSIVQMIEDFGTALFKIEKKSTPHFGVKTPYLAAVVKGTTFTVTVGGEGASVQVTEGRVAVATLDGGASQLVTPGVIAMVSAQDIYRLNVQGDVSKIIRSPNAPAGGKASQGAPSASYSGPPAKVVEVAAPVGEDPQPLTDATDGLVNGDPAVKVAMAEFADQAHDAAKDDHANQPDPDPTPPPGPNGDHPGQGDHGHNPPPPPPADDSHGNPGQGDQGDNPGQGDHGDNPGHGDQGDNPGQGDHGDNPGHGDQGDNPGRGDHGDNPGHGDQGDNPDRGHHGDNPDHGDQGDNPGRDDHGDDPDRGDHGDNPGHADQGDNPDHGDQGDKPGPDDHGDKPGPDDHADHPGPNDHADQPGGDHGMPGDHGKPDPDHGKPGDGDPGGKPGKH